MRQCADSITAKKSFLLKDWLLASTMIPIISDKGFNRSRVVLYNRLLETVFELQQVLNRFFIHTLEF